MPDILPALANRRARRAFDPRPVPDEFQQLLWQAVSVAPSHGNSQPVRLLVARSGETRSALIAALSDGNRTWAPAAPLLVALGALPSHGGTVANSDGTSREYWAFHAGIAAAHLMAQATDIGLIAHPMANFDEPAARAAFAAPTDLRILVVVAIGYPGDAETLPEDLQKRESAPQDRIPLANLLVEDRWADENALSARDLRDRAKADSEHGPPVGASGRSALDVARECSMEARRIAMAAYGSIVITESKGRGNVVTETDLAVEDAVKAILAREFPGHALLAEETAASTRADGWMWVVDPIDGTKNFSRGIPHFGFGLALCHDSDPVLALSLHLVTGDEFLAVKGEGFRLNGIDARVSDVATVRDAVVAFEMGYHNACGARQLATAAALWPGMQSLRITGSAVLGPAFVAAGRWDIYVHLDLKPWDIAGGLLLVREAGGVATQRDGSPATIFSESVICATPGVHADFLRLAADIPWEA